MLTPSLKLGTVGIVDNEPGVTSHHDVPPPPSAAPEPMRASGSDSPGSQGQNDSQRQPDSQRRFRRPPPRRRFGRDRRPPGPPRPHDRNARPDQSGASNQPNPQGQGSSVDQEGQSGQPTEENSETQNSAEGAPQTSNPQEQAEGAAPEGQTPPPPRRNQDQRPQRPQRPQQNQSQDRASRDRSRHLSQLYANARVQVERIRRDLEGVLAELEKLSALLSQAEHDQDLTEQEIETLKDALHNLHRGQTYSLRTAEPPVRSEE